MLRAVVGQDLVGEVALQQFRAPPLPGLQIADQYFDALVAVMAAQQFGGTRWRASTCIEEGNAGLAARKGLVDDRDIANNEGQKAKAHASLDHDEDARQSAQRRDIPESE